MGYRGLGGNIGGIRGKGCQGTCIKDTWTKPKGGRIEGGRWGWLGSGGVEGGKWIQLYLNNKKFKIFFKDSLFNKQCCENWTDNMQKMKII